MKLIKNHGIRCEKCANAKKYVSGPSEYEKSVVEWAFQLNGLPGACHDFHEFVGCALKKRFPSSGECAWFEKK